MASHNDIRGQLLNSLNTGVTTTDALSELFDNSISAGSTEIHLKLSDNILNLSDNGPGMGPEILEDSTWLNRRTTSSSKRHGRFGIGKKQAESTLTKLKGSVTTFSSDGNTISQITTNYPRVLQTGVYAPQVSGLQCDSQRIWVENAREPEGTGTLTSICLHEDVRREISEKCDDDTVTGLRFLLATTYRDDLIKGLKITIQNGDNDIYQVYPFDRLCSSKCNTVIPPDAIYFNYRSHDVHLLQKEGEIDSYYMKTVDGGSKQFDQTKQKWNDVIVPASFDLDTIEKFKYEMAYSPNWNPLQQDELTKNGIMPLSGGQKGVAVQRTKTDGKELVRNGKVIKHSEYKFRNIQNTVKKIDQKTRVRISFTASEGMDDVWNVQVNKSSVNETQIDPNLLKALDQLKTAFMSECHKAIESINSVNDSSVGQVKSSSMSSPLTSPISSSPPPPPSDQMVPSKINTKTKPKLKIALKKTQTHLSDSHSESDSDHEITAAGGAICGGGGGGGGYAVGGGNSHSTEISRFAPDSECDIGSSKRQYIFRKTGENMLEEWKKSGKYPEILNETLDKMHIEFSGKIAADTLKRYLNCIPLNEKYDLLLEMIREKYASPETPMKMGIELQRIYNKTFEADIAAGTSSPM